MPAAIIVRAPHNLNYRGPQFVRFYHLDIYVFCFRTFRQSREMLYLAPPKFMQLLSRYALLGDLYAV